MVMSALSAPPHRPPRAMFRLPRPLPLAGLRRSCLCRWCVRGEGLSALEAQNVARGAKERLFPHAQQLPRVQKQCLGLGKGAGLLHGATSLASLP